MAEYVYPAVFHPNHDEEGSYTIIFPDLPGCISEGKSLENALYMASDALRVWLTCTEEMGDKIPPASTYWDIQTEGDEFVSLVRAVIRDNRAVRRTVSLPKWMDEKASDAGLSLSKILQDALKEYLSIS